MRYKKETLISELQSNAVMVLVQFLIQYFHPLSDLMKQLKSGSFKESSSQWSEGVTKPIKKYSQIDTVWDFFITFGCKMKE